MPFINIHPDTYNRFLQFSPRFEDDPDSVLISLLELAEQGGQQFPECGDAAADDAPAIPAIPQNHGGGRRPQDLPDELPRHVNRPTLNMNWIEEDPILIFPAPEGGVYRIRHQVFAQIVRQYRPRTYAKYHQIGNYNWPYAPRWMQSALEGYRES